MTPPRPQVSPLRVRIASCVGGGPMERLAGALRRRGHDAEVVQAMSPETWRRRMSQGRLGRLRARSRAFLGFPGQVVADAASLDRRVVVPTTNPFLLPLVLVATRPLHGRPVIPLVYDLYPDALEAGGVAARGGLVGRVAEAANRWWFRRADAVVFIGRRMADHARDRYGEPRRWAVIETGASASELDPEVLRTPAQTDLERWCEQRTVIAYVGNLGRVHDWDTLREAVPLLLSEPAHGGRPFGVVIAASGPGVAALRRAWRDLPADHVRFEAPLPDQQWARLLARTHVSLVTLRREASRTCIPSKALTAMAAGSALLAVAPADSDLADLIGEHRCGDRVEPGDVTGLVRAIRRYVTDERALEADRRRARAAAITHYDVEQLAGRWQRLLDDTLADWRGPGPAYEVLKRAIDIVAAGTAVVLASPILLATAAAVRLTMGSPVLFRQPRPGRNGEPFNMAKFRTMRDARPEEIGPEHDAARLTRLGQLLRTTSVDELPTLLTVLRGDMSLVGPRPLLMRYLPRYTDEQARRHQVAPGVTGWAQVNGRNAISWEEKFDRDVWYVENRSLALDLRILLQTVLKVVGRADISQAEHATMPEFMGTGAVDRA